MQPRTTAGSAVVQQAPGSCMIVVLPRVRQDLLHCPDIPAGTPAASLPVGRKQAPQHLVPAQARAHREPQSRKRAAAPAASSTAAAAADAEVVLPHGALGGGVDQQGESVRPGPPSWACRDQQLLDV